MTDMLNAECEICEIVRCETAAVCCAPFWYPASSYEEQDHKTTRPQDHRARVLYDKTSQVVADGKVLLRVLNRPRTKFGTMITMNGDILRA